jgi:hypothetical protein
MPGAGPQANVAAAPFMPTGSGGGGVNQIGNPNFLYALSAIQNRPGQVQSY